MGRESEVLTEMVAGDVWGELLREAGSRVVKGIVLAGQASRNGYSYTEMALRDAVVCYDGKPVYLDHHEQSHQPGARGDEELVGVIESPRFEAGKVVGDICVRESVAGNLFLSLVDKLLPDVGMSHVVRAVRSRDGRRVEKIVDVISVDVVRYPATTKTLRESTLWAGEELEESVDEEMGEVELICEISPSAETSSRLRDAEPVVMEELSLLRQEVSRWKQIAEKLQEQSGQAARVQVMLEKSRLPESAITPVFRRMLMEAESDQKRDELIRERRELVTQLRVVSPVSSARRVEEVGMRDAEIVAAIRRGAGR
jgi:hypothetical protein